jgi:hypothetical protein
MINKGHVWRLEGDVTRCKCGVYLGLWDGKSECQKQNLTFKQESSKVINTMKNTTKGKQGRPKGSFSFVTVSMEDLNKVVGPQGHVTVAAKFAKELGLSAKTGPALKMHSQSAPTEGTIAVATVTPAVVPAPTDTTPVTATP